MSVEGSGGNLPGIVWGECVSEDDKQVMEGVLIVGEGEYTVRIEGRDLGDIEQEKVRIEEFLTDKNAVELERLKDRGFTISSGTVKELSTTEKAAHQTFFRVIPRIEANAFGGYQQAKDTMPGEFAQGNAAVGKRAGTDSSQKKEWWRTRDLAFLHHPNAIPFVSSLETSNKLIHIWRTQGCAGAFKKRRKFLEGQIEQFRPIIEQQRKEAAEDPDDPRNILYQFADNTRNQAARKKTGIIIKKTKGGYGGAHFVLEKGDPKAVLKTVNGDVGTIDNPSGLAYPYHRCITRPVENYESVQKEALAYDLSQACDCKGAVPPTVLCLVDNPEFHTFFDNPGVKETLNALEGYQRDEVMEKLGRSSSTRLCCLQEAVEKPMVLNSLLLCWGTEGAEALPFDQESFEDVMHLTRLMGETDGHADNYLVQRKIVKGKEKYFLVKIDSGFAFPNQNAGAMNCLTALPNAREPISDRYRNVILNADPAEVEQLMKKYHLNSNEIKLAKERIRFMKSMVIKYPNITHREMELRLRLFAGNQLLVRDRFNKVIDNPSFSQRKDFALHKYTPKELRQYKDELRVKFAAADHDDALLQVRGGGLIKTARPFKAEKKRSEIRAKINECQEGIAAFSEQFTKVEGVLDPKVRELFSSQLERFEDEMGRIESNLMKIEERIRKMGRFEKAASYKQKYDIQKRNLVALKANLEQQLESIQELLSDLNEGRAPVEPVSYDWLFAKSSDAESPANLPSRSGYAREATEAPEGKDKAEAQRGRGRQDMGFIMPNIPGEDDSSEEYAGPFPGDDDSSEEDFELGRSIETQKDTYIPGAGEVRGEGAYLEHDEEDFEGVDYKPGVESPEEAGHQDMGYVDEVPGGDRGKSETEED